MIGLKCLKQEQIQNKNEYMENKICNNCGSFDVVTDNNKQKHYFCTFRNTYPRPSDSCEYWNQTKLEREVEPPKEEVTKTIRVWNPHSRRHEDVKA